MLIWWKELMCHAERFLQNGVKHHRKNLITKTVAATRIPCLIDKSFIAGIFEWGQGLSLDQTHLDSHFWNRKREFPGCPIKCSLNVVWITLLEWLMMMSFSNMTRNISQIKAFILKYKASLRIEHTTPYFAVACKSKKILFIVGTL